MHMTQLDPLAIGLAFLPALYFSIFVHEVGHAVIGRAAGYVVTSLGLGVARPLCVLPVRGVKVYLCLAQPHNGITFAFHPQILPSRARAVAFLAGGILFNSGLALTSLALVQWTSWGRNAWLALSLVNGSLAIGALIPYQYKVGKAVLRSDGALILQTLRSGAYSSPSAITVQGVEFLQALSSSIGDAALSHISLLGGAEAWGDLEDFERANALLDRATAQPDSGIPALRGVGGYVRAQLALWMGRPDDADAALDAAESIYRSEGNEIGALVVSVLRAAARLHRGDPASAASALAPLRSNPLLQSRPTLGQMLVSLQLAAAVAVSDLPAIERLLAEYETIRRKLPSATRDLKIYRAVARFHAQRGTGRRRSRRTAGCSLASTRSPTLGLTRPKAPVSSNVTGAWLRRPAGASSR
jgi:hypothetical protein